MTGNALDPLKDADEARVEHRRGVVCIIESRAGVHAKAGIMEKRASDGTFQLAQLEVILHNNVE